MPQHSATFPLLVRLKRCRVLWLLAGSAALVLSGCSGQAAPASSGIAGAPASSAVAAATPQAGSRTTAPPSSSAAGLRARVQDSLQTLAASSPQPSRDQVKAALVKAGAAPAAIEVSASKTPTGLAVDALTAAVLDGKQCVMGQVRSGAVSTTVLPVLANGRCFVGDDRG